MNKALHAQALILRRQGYSFREISGLLGIAKSTASLWARAERLDKRAQERIKLLGDRGRERAVQTNKRRRELVWRNIARDCLVLRDGRHYGMNEYKIFLALLYWGEGAKTNGNFWFINSDPGMISLYMLLLRKSFSVDEGRFKVWLHLHEYHHREEMIVFWSKVTGICKNQFSVYNKPHTGINKKLGYKGCLSIRYKDSKILKEIFIIIKRLCKFS